MSVQYVRPTRDEFESWFDKHYTYEEADTPWGEVVYDLPLPADNKTIRIFTTVNKGNDDGRDKGSDAIRCVVWDHEVDEPVGGRERTNRIRTDDDPIRYLRNLNEKIQWLYKNWRAFNVQLAGACPECGGDLSGHESEYGEFLSCQDCDWTEDLPDKDCPECEDGGLHYAEGQYGPYYWCDQCDHTEDA